MTPATLPSKHQEADRGSLRGGRGEAGLRGKPGGGSRYFVWDGAGKAQFDISHPTTEERETGTLAFKAPRREKEKGERTTNSKQKKKGQRSTDWRVEVSVSVALMSCERWKSVRVAPIKEGGGERTWKGIGTSPLLNKGLHRSTFKICP